MPAAGKIVSGPNNSSVEQEVAGSSAAQVTLVPAGHFYSPIPSHEDVRQNEERIFKIPDSIAAIDLNIEEQMRTLEALGQYANQCPFQSQKTEGLRYFFQNPMFGYADGSCLYALIRHLKPRRIIEVGAGYSSCLILDTNERFMGNRVSCTFIEPNPESFLGLIERDDLKRIQLLKVPLQDVELNLFSTLTANDILFIDSSHVSKVGSDVNYLVFEILPRLAPGVYVHFHDIFYPFEYPKRWICDLGISWNEAYLLRAFLQYNQSFCIALFINYLERFHAEQFRRLLPQSVGGAGGGLWLRRI